MDLQPINPLEYISPHDPVPQRILNASRWFVVEVLELDFGDYVGRPSQHALVRVQLLSYLFANGWYVDAVQGGGEGGEWKSVSNSSTTSDGGTVTRSHSSTVSDSNTSSHTSSNTSSHTSSSTSSHTSSSTSSHTSSSTSSHTSSSTSSHTSSSTSSNTSSSTSSHTSGNTDGSTQTHGSSQGSSQGSSRSQSSSHSFSFGISDNGYANSNGSAQSHASGQAHSQACESTHGSSRTHSTTSSGTNGRTSSGTAGKTASETAGKTASETTGKTTSETTGKTASGTTGKTVSKTQGDTDSDTESHTSTGSITNSSSSTTTNGGNRVGTTNEGPYWYAYVRIRLKRRKLQAELVMKDMVEDLTKAYNEGRKINDDRYDELVNLYALMLGRSEGEGNAFIADTADIKPLTDYVLLSMKKTVADFHAVVDNLPDDVFKNRVREINLKFDNQLSKAKVEMITAGLFNSTVWTTTASGIERNREMALNDLIETKIDVYVKVAAASGDLGQKFTDAAARLQGMAKLRNEVFKWMLDFMERRKDEFPGLDQIAGAAKQLGYAETTTSNGVK